jgi:hypothetical protein
LIDKLRVTKRKEFDEEKRQPGKFTLQNGPPSRAITATSSELLKKYLSEIS